MERFSTTLSFELSETARIPAPWWEVEGERAPEPGRAPFRQVRRARALLRMPPEGIQWGKVEPGWKVEELRPHGGVSRFIARGSTLNAKRPAVCGSFVIPGERQGRA